LIVERVISTTVGNDELILKYGIIPFAIRAPHVLK